MIKSRHIIGLYFSVNQMTTYYSVCPCKSISYIKNTNHIADVCKGTENLEAYALTDSTRKHIFDNISIGNTVITDIQAIKSIKSSSTIRLIVDCESSIFDDVKIATSSEENISQRKPTENSALGDHCLGKTDQINAMHGGEFMISPGKRGANIKQHHNKQNHQVLDSIARNGILVVPYTGHAVHRLMVALSDSHLSFEIVFIHSDLGVAVKKSTRPNEYAEPAPTTSKGTITAILYRYICMYFFGYFGVYSEEDRERDYDP